MDKVDWNDLRYVAAVIRGGSALGAGRILNVSHTTVLRRIQAIEQCVGAPLFERLSTGYVPTDIGRTLCEVALSTEKALVDTGRLIDSSINGLAGVVRFTTTDTLAYFLMPPILAEFNQRYPLIKVDMIVTNNLLDLDKRDADVSLRPSPSPPETWVGRKLVRVNFGVYASAHYLAGRSEWPWQELDCLLPSGPLSTAAAAQWLRREVGERGAAFSIDSFVGLSSLAAKGLGITVLPRMVGDASADLVRIANAPDDASVDLWLLTHANLRQASRIRVFMDYLAEAIRGLRLSGAA
ncbi:DNA-binding transcriptional LysR family regulator [Duganella sp. SG902]|uniref:LysR family transcriptional regulator n=1 Tax=Duganella sp. SG902 TaxID=2587016 RepID=UPI00159D1311|nr:LysR family transcriptional regulator [Duganella sp. SG902]NVM77517.1 DNA-binding transcriptional LysR family regulator [Duganella sp. SG902]